MIISLILTEWDQINAPHLISSWDWDWMWWKVEKLKSVYTWIHLWSDCLKHIIISGVNNSVFRLDFTDRITFEPCVVFRCSLIGWTVTFILWRVSVSLSFIYGFLKGTIDPWLYCSSLSSSPGPCEPKETFQPPGSQDLCYIQNTWSRRCDWRSSDLLKSFLLIHQWVYHKLNKHCGC